MIVADHVERNTTSPDLDKSGRFYLGGNMERLNLKLNRAHDVKDDEFYTPFKFVANELEHYSFSGDRPIVCPCDGESSAFVKWFRAHGFDPIYSAGDFIDALERAPDRAIVVTNPPFSLFRKFVTNVLTGGVGALFARDRGFDLLAVGANVAASAIDVFPFIKAGRLRGGYTCDRSIAFERPDGGFKNAPVSWYTTLPVERKSFTPSRSFADLEACGKIVYLDDKSRRSSISPRINLTSVIYVDKVENYPADYYGFAAIPSNSFYRFEGGGFDFIAPIPDPYVDGEAKFRRIIVKRKKDV